MRIFTCISFLFLILFTASAQETFPVNGTSDSKHITYVFTNARIITDYKTVIDSGIMIVRDGLIQSIGSNPTIDKDAVVYDLKGKSIYPSFIDIFSDYGQAEIKKNNLNDDSPQFLSSQKGAYGWNEAVRAEFEGHLNFTADEKKAEELRKLGFGSVLSINKDGIFRGSSPLVLLADGKENDLIIRSHAAANLSFNKGTSSQDYPGSLMGAIALIRQSYYDAQWYMNGGNQKEYNISLEAINKLQTLPQIFDAGDKQNEMRAATLGKEFGIKYIIKGSGEEYERIKEIKETQSSIIVPLNFPEAIDLSDPYDALNTTLHEFKHWELAPYNPAELEKAGINFALTTSDLKNKADFLKNLKKAVAAGLSESQALKSITYTPAQLLGLENKIGSLNKGMIANFIIAAGNLFEKENILFENWVHGKRYIINDLELEDLSGNYTLKLEKENSYRMQISGKLTSPEISIYIDSVATKATSSRSGAVLSISFEIKKPKPQGLYRLAGTINSSNPYTLSGEALLPDGTWSKWTANFDSLSAQQTKPDSVSKENSGPGNILYPNMAFGWKTLPEAKTVLFKNATTWTNESQGILKNADVIISAGKIKEVGTNLKAPAGAVIIDATGKHLTSGIIDEHSHIAVSSSVNEPTQSSSAEVRIGDVVDADDVNIYRQLAGGVTVSHLLHGSANAIGGQTQLIKLRWGMTPEKLKFENWPGFIKFALGENVKQSHWGDKQVLRFPQTRMGVEQVYFDYFTKAKEYEKNLKNEGSTKLKNQIPTRKDLELDALVEIMNSKRFITCHSYVQSEINMLMHIADTFGFKINTFTHILEGYKVADKMKAHGVTGVSTFSDWWGYKFEVYEAIPYNGSILHKMNLNVAYNSDDAEMARRLNQEAAKAVMYGRVPEEEAWKFVTLNPAKMLRIDDRVGSIKAGKDADLVLWNENPLSILAKPLQTYVDGILYFDADRDEQMRIENNQEKARITAKMIDAKGKGETAKKPASKKMILKHCDDEEIQ